MPRGIEIVENIMEQDTCHDKTIADFLAQEDRANGKRQGVEVNKRERNNEMVRVGDPGNRRQDQYEWGPSRSIGSDILPEKRQQKNAFAKTAKHRRPPFSDHVT